MEIIENLLKVNMQNFNIFTVISILFLVGGIIFYLLWGAAYGVWYDIGIYSITIVLVIPGLVGIILSLKDKTTE